MSTFVRKILGIGLLDDAKAPLQRCVERIQGADVVGGAGGLVMYHSFEAATAGFAVGLGIRAVASLLELKLAKDNGPFRYLTMMEKSGVSFVMAR